MWCTKCSQIQKQNYSLQKINVEETGRTPITQLNNFTGTSVPHSKHDTEHLLLHNQRTDTRHRQN